MFSITQSLALSFPLFGRMLSFLRRQVRLIFVRSLLFVLCPRVSSFDFHGSARDMVSSFLTDRSMVVEMNGQKSSSRALFSGVPQRSVPLHLFFIYICQLSVWTNSSLDRRDLNDLIAWVNEDLESIVRWSTENGLLLSPTKSQAILVSNSPSTLPLPILFLSGVALEWKNVVTVDMLRRFVPKFMLRWECVRSFATIVVHCTSFIFVGLIMSPSIVIWVFHFLYFLIFVFCLFL
jgi:hypothetical protein